MDINENEIDGSVAYLSLFATWVSQFNPTDDTDPKHFDQAILITKRICGLATSTCYENGRGYFGDMCSTTRSVASATAAGLSAALTAAHETGHKLVSCDNFKHVIVGTVWRMLYIPPCSKISNHN